MYVGPLGYFELLALGRVEHALAGLHPLPASLCLCVCGLWVSVCDVCVCRGGGGGGGGARGRVDRATPAQKPPPG
jgi:hypothetical protein